MQNFFSGLCEAPANVSIISDNAPGVNRARSASSLPRSVNSVAPFCCRGSESFSSRRRSCCREYGARCRWHSSHGPSTNDDRCRWHSSHGPSTNDDSFSHSNSHDLRRPRRQPSPKRRTNAPPRVPKRKSESTESNLENDASTFVRRPERTLSPPAIFSAQTA